jgi:hypothetical protein
MLQLWVGCKRTRWLLSHAVNDTGWNRATAYRVKDKALSILFHGLERDAVGVPPRRPACDTLSGSLPCRSGVL